jgi:hypothetical protein
MAKSILFLLISLALTIIPFSDRVNAGTVYIPVGKGIIVTPGITIAAEDGSFELVSGKPFTPPFQMKCYGSEGIMSGITLPTYYEAHKYLTGGAKRVVVTQEGKDRPLYGMLVFCMVYDTSYGLGATSYEIRIDSEKIEAPMAGGYSEVFEKVYFKELGMKLDSYAPGWVLYLFGYRPPDVSDENLRRMER